MNNQQNPDLAVHTSAIPMEGLLGESGTTLEKNVIVTQLSEGVYKIILKQLSDYDYGLIDVT
ncbi:MAG: hypothetical protein V7K14_23770 [Nostoc sp.]|uniref:hypothetical protein n=1 Tax=Nostoc sp. TaxID=1180 RepID=UPI002FF77F20